MLGMELVKENIECEQLLGENTSNSVIKGEYIIPDTLPDVFEILILEAKPVISKKEVISDKVFIEGQVEYNLIYLSKEDGNSCIYNVNYSGKFSNYVEIEGADHNMICDTDCYVEHFECSVINERKISIEGIINIKAEIYKLYDFEIIKDVKDSTNIQFLKSPTSIDKVVGTVSRDLIAKTHLEVPGDQPQIGTVLKCDVNVHKKEVILLENKVQVEAFAKIGLLYRAEESREINYLEDDVFVNSEADLEGVSQAMEAFADFNTDAMDINIKQDDLGENRLLDIEALIKADIKVMSKESMDMIEDAYSPDVVLNMDKKNYALNVIHGHNVGDTVVKGNIDTHNLLKPTHILCCDGKVNINDKKIVEDKVLIEGVLNVNVTYKTTEELNYVSASNEDFPFNITLEIPGAKIDMQCIAKAFLENIEAVIEGGTVAVKAIVSAEARVNYISNIDFLVDLNPSDNEVPKKKASVTIYAIQPGDTLWKIAKKYYTTVDTILGINEIQNPDEVRYGDKLIIPGRAII